MIYLYLLTLTCICVLKEPNTENFAQESDYPNLQLTFNIFDYLVDYANALSGNTVFDESHRVVLKNYQHLGEKTGGGGASQISAKLMFDNALCALSMPFCRTVIAEMIFTIFHPMNPFSHGSMTLISFVSKLIALLF